MPSSSDSGSPFNMSALSLSVVPGKALGPFQLDMSINSAIEYLKQNARSIRECELAYSEESPVSDDIIVHLSQEHITLRFDGTRQRLWMIEVAKFDRLKISYAGTVFSTPKTLPTFAIIYKLFGPSFPGGFDQQRLQYTLRYPGLRFTFAIPAEFSSYYSDGDDIHLEFPNGVSPSVAKICILVEDVVKAESSEAPDVALAMSLATLSALPGYGSDGDKNDGPSAPFPRESDDLEFLPGVGLHAPRTDSRVSFGDSCQDVLTELGSPSKVYYKEEDKMRIYAMPGTTSDTPCGDYFYNYFHLGLDILFLASTHKVSKFVLHTNFPNCYDFNIYHRSMFRILVNSIVDDEEPSDKKPFAITPLTNWTDMCRILGEPNGKPVMSTKGPGTNPFGPTRFYGNRNMIFEVMRNGSLSSVTLFDPAATST